MANLVRRQKGGEPALLERLDPFRSFRDWLGWDPFAEIETMTGDVRFTPSMDVRETQDAYLFRADVPGLKEEDIEVSVTGNRITLSGKREEEQRKEGERWYVYERSYGSFSRSFTLPEGVKPDEVKAELKEGVLTITVPKQAEAQRRRIPLGTGKAEAGEGKQVLTEGAAGKKAA